MSNAPATKATARKATATKATVRNATVMGDAWSWLVMREALCSDVSRFDDFRDRLGIARSTLAGRLAQLTAAGVLSRQAGRQYIATESGRSFFGSLMVAMRFGDRWYFAGAPPQTATHRACGRDVNATVRCEACRQVLAAPDLTTRRTATPAAARRAAAPKPPRRRSPDLDLLERNRMCSIARTLTITGDGWSELIIRECGFGTGRFDDFGRRLGIAPNMLSARLRRLVELDILTKTQDETGPARYEYGLTKRGDDCFLVTLAVHAWRQQWIGRDTDVRLTHAPCRSPLHAEIACASCAQTFTRADIDVAAAAISHQ